MCVMYGAAAASESLAWALVSKTFTRPRMHLTSWSPWKPVCSTMTDPAHLLSRCGFFSFNMQVSCDPPASVGSFNDATPELFITLTEPRLCSHYSFTLLETDESHRVVFYCRLFSPFNETLLLLLLGFPSFLPPVSSLASETSTGPPGSNSWSLQHIPVSEGCLRLLQLLL